MPGTWPRQSALQYKTAILSITISAGLVASAVQAQPTNISDHLENIRTAYIMPALTAAFVQDGTDIAAAAVGTRTEVLGQILITTSSTGRTVTRQTF
ncbi:hypothetical protein [Roseicitreum antarcticum]|uniref:Uncharacterized protein n=1 Tax=Roseicitreum antarcticum TaxID=564137 RepID=A0A1H3FJW1_9RHOB|nr:hypothetical protein [Roseicitreum antarcticum]SDX90434.1 hypothetical protein SAMN04488238_1403 [Roseicitreum antarcticum]